jgi:hypothetical protein
MPHPLWDVSRERHPAGSPGRGRTTLPRGARSTWRVSGPRSNTRGIDAVGWMGGSELIGRCTGRRDIGHGSNEQPGAGTPLPHRELIAVPAAFRICTGGARGRARSPRRSAAEDPRGSRSLLHRPACSAAVVVVAGSGSLPNPGVAMAAVPGWTARARSHEPVPPSSYATSAAFRSGTHSSGPTPFPSARPITAMPPQSAHSDAAMKRTSPRPIAFSKDPETELLGLARPDHPVSGVRTIAQRGGVVVTVGPTPRRPELARSAAASARGSRSAMRRPQRAGLRSRTEPCSCPLRRRRTR